MDIVKLRFLFYCVYYNYIYFILFIMFDDVGYEVLKIEDLEGDKFWRLLGIKFIRIYMVV